MKRCPECDFLYEDDQVLCDMEGAALVFEAHPAFEKAPVAGTTKPPVKSRRWQFAFLATSLAILAVSFPVLNNYRHLNSPVREAAAETSIGTSPAHAVETVNSAGQTIATPSIEKALPQPALDSGSPNNLEKTLPKPLPTISPEGNHSTERDIRLNEKVSPKTSQRKTAGLSRSIGNNRAKTGGIQIIEVRPRRSANFQIAQANPHAHEAASNKDSKISSFLKKTGRVLKKPFQF